jgi:hypothetical protein
LGQSISALQVETTFPIKWTNSKFLIKHDLWIFWNK